MPHMIVIKCQESYQLNPNNPLSHHLGEQISLTSGTCNWSNTPAFTCTDTVQDYIVQWHAKNTQPWPIPADTGPRTKGREGIYKGDSLTPWQRALETIRTRFLHSHGIQTWLKRNASFHYLLFGLDKAWEGCTKAYSCIWGGEITESAPTIETVQE